MLKRYFSAVFVLLACSSFSINSLGNAQTTTIQPSTAANGLNLFSIFQFDPKDVAQFLWSSLRPTYRSGISSDLGNASEYLEYFSSMVLGKNATEQIFSNPFLPTLLDVVDTQLGNVFKNVDPNNITGDEILSRLVNLNQDAFLKAATRGAFLQVETMLNGDRLKRLESVIGHLENDTSVESMLHDAFEMMGFPAPLPAWLNNSITDLDGDLRQLVTMSLSSNTDWQTSSTLQKLGLVIQNFDYMPFGEKVLKSISQNLPTYFRGDLRDFLFILERPNLNRPLNLSSRIQQNVPALYNYIQMMLQTQNITLPSMMPIDLSNLEAFHIYDAIENELKDAMTVILSNTTLYNSMWLNGSVTDLQRLARLLSNVNYQEIGEDIIRSIINMINEGTELRAYFEQFLFEILSPIINIPDNGTISATNITLITDPITDLVVSTLNESLVLQSQNNTNWAIYSNSEKLRDVLMNFDYQKLLQGSAMVFFQNGEDLVTPEFRQSIIDVMVLLKANDGQRLYQKLSHQMDELKRLANFTTPKLLESVEDRFVTSVAVGVILSYQNLNTSVNSTVQNMLSNNNLNFSSLSDFEQFGVVMTAVDYQFIGENTYMELDRVLETSLTYFLNKLERGSVVPELEAAWNTIVEALPISTNISEMLTKMAGGCDITGRMLEDINKQLKLSYSAQYTSAEWNNASTSTLDKIQLLVTNYDYAATGNVLMLEGLCMTEAQMPQHPKKLLDDLISAIATRSSVVEAMEAIKMEMLPYAVSQLSLMMKNMNLPANVTSAERMIELVMSYASRNALMPFYKVIDLHIQNFTDQQLNDWNSINGRLEKVLKFGMSMSNDEMMKMMMEMGRGVFTNVIVQVSANSLPEDAANMMGNFMNMLESEAFEHYINTTLASLLKNVPMGSSILSNNVVQSMIRTLSSFLSDTYKAVRYNTGDEWMRMTAAEKTLIVLLSADMPKLMDSMQKSFDNSTAYYRDILQPVYTPQCGWDLDNVTYTLTNVFNGKEEDRWVIGFVDSWGKIPSAIFGGRFIWPGDMKQCQDVKGNRVLVVNDSTTVLEKDGIKGAWGMAYFSLPASLGLQGNPATAAWGSGAMLQYGYCLPESCTYDDSMKFLGRASLIGLDVKALKPRSIYPVFSGEYKTDSKFIGISIMFGAFIVTILVCTLIDGLVLKKKRNCAEKDNEKNDSKYAMTSLPAYTEKEEPAADNAVVYNGADRAYTNGGFEHNEKLPIDEVPAETSTPSKHTAKEASKPSIGIQLIKAFSLYENLPKLLDSTPKPNQLQALDGIRFLSMTWVIYGHAIVFPVGYLQNMAVIRKLGANGDWIFHAIAAGLFAVDSFFLLSGLLVGYLFLKALDKVKGKIRCMTLVLYYVHRFLRLIPLYGGIILLTIAYHRYLGSGPFSSWHSKEVPQEFCQTNWWANLLFINNLYQPEKMCNGVSWYLANDMQFYVISPLLLIPLYWKPRAGIAFISALWATHIGLTGWEWSKRSGGSNFSDFAVFQDIYIKPWTRIGPYLIGLLLAFILFKKCKIRSNVVKALCWLVSLGTICICVFMPYDATKEGGIATSSWDKVQRAAYETLCKSAWAIALGWVIYACNTGCGGFIASGLNWPGWAPLSKLTYAAYLIHPLIMDSVYKNRYNLIYFDSMSILFQNTAFVALSYLIGAVLHLMLEAPMLTIEKILLPNRRK